MFEEFDPVTPDPILGLMAEFRNDSRPEKTDLGVGVYRDEAGDTPILPSVLKAESRALEAETTKSYIGPPGTPEFNVAVRQLIFGAGHPVLADGRVGGVQTPGGCGGLRVAAETIKRVRPNASIWTSDPTWANHVPLLGSAGLDLKEYPYFDSETNALRVDAMLSALAEVPAGDVVLLHGCCHNPTGVDLALPEWKAITALANERGFLPFIDLAYQGLGNGLDEDVEGLRYMAAEVPEMIVVMSASKNFGLYRERVGSVQVMSANQQTTAVVESQIAAVVRGIYSMPPAHGAAIVETILGDETLTAEWHVELDEMRDRINGLRTRIAKALTLRTNRDFSFIERQRGMFSFLGLTVDQVNELRDKYAVYMVDSSRINIAGANESNIDHFVEAVASVLR